MNEHGVPHLRKTCSAQAAHSKLRSAANNEQERVRRSAARKLIVHVNHPSHPTEIADMNPICEQSPKAEVTKCGNVTQQELSISDLCISVPRSLHSTTLMSLVYLDPLRHRKELRSAVHNNGNNPLNLTCKKLSQFVRKAQP